MNGYVEKNRSLTEQVLDNIDEKYVRMTLEYLGWNARAVRGCINGGTESADGFTESVRGTTDRLNTGRHSFSESMRREAIMRSKKGKARGWRWTACRAAACVLLVCAVSFSALTTATAAGSLTAYQLLYSLYPAVAVRLTPVNVSCEDNGIRMEVEAVNVSGSRADIYISLQDMTGDRVDETLDLFDSYSIHTTCDQIGGCSLVSYDAESKTATFLIRVEQMGGKEVAGAKMTFSVSELLYGKKNTVTELSQIRLPNVREAERIQTDVPVRGAGGMLSEYSEEMRNKFLIPDEQFRFSPADGAWITGYAMVDGMLHIQTYYEDILHYDNHGFLFLKDAEGDIRNCLVNVAFWDAERSGSYEEYIFDLGLGDRPEDYTVWGDFTTCRSAIMGNWEVSFLISE